MEIFFNVPTLSFLLKTKYLNVRPLLDVFGGTSPNWSSELYFGVLVSVIYSLSVFSLINFHSFL